MKFKTKSKEICNIKYLVTSPMNQEPDKAIILFTEAHGINGHVKNLACRFSELGYQVYIPQIYDKKSIDFHIPYHKHDLRKTMVSKLDVTIFSSRLANSVKYFEKYKTIHSIGFSIGGYLSLLSSSILPISKNISFYPNPSPSNHQYLNFPNMESWLSKTSESIIFLGDKDHSIPTSESNIFNKHPQIKVHIVSGQHGFFCNNRHTYNKNSSLKCMEIIKYFLID